MQLFWEKGYGSTSVADVLQAAGVNSGSLYHFFPGKQDLLLAVLEAYRGGIGEMLLAPAWKGVADPIEKIFALLARYRQSVVQTDCVYGCPIGSLALEIHEPDPPVRKALAENFNAWVDAVEQCLLEADLHCPKGPTAASSLSSCGRRWRGCDAGAHAPGRCLLRSRGTAITDVFGLS